MKRRFTEEQIISFLCGTGHNLRMILAHLRVL